MKGLEISILPLSEARRENNVFRCDAEFFKKENLRALALLRRKGAVALSSFAKVTDGVHQSLPFVEDGPVKVLSAKHPKNNAVDRSHFETVDEAFQQANPRTALRVGDVIVSTVGTIGNAAVITGELLPANCDRHLGLIRSSDVSPYVLSTFLNSTYGRLQTKREATGNVQLNLFISKIDALLCPKFSRELESWIRVLTEQAYDLQATSRGRTAEAELVLVEKLGLSGWAPSQPLTYQSSYRAVQAADRLDSEFYRPMFAEAQAAITKAGATGWVSMAELATQLTNGHTPLRHDLTVGEVPFLCAEHVSDFTVNFDSAKRVLLEQHEGELKQTRVRNGDLLLTIKGRIGNLALVEDMTVKANINQDVALLRLNGELPTWWVLAFLNSPLGKLQVKRLSTGAINPFLGLANVARLLIPRFPPETMAEVAEATRFKVNAARLALERSERLLAKATHAIDLALEQDEAAALAFLREGL